MKEAKTKNMNKIDDGWRGARDKRQIYQRRGFFPVSNSFVSIALTACIRIFGAKLPSRFNGFWCIRG